ncbi:twin-arginine translocation signal domain-containing protein [Natrinema sp. 74]|uniref:twin-arginine translocation signal domain-containing protein n=1 Tax=Natrinema sp. 74 TaxID=3384159 RepID=UPI0038D35E80
MARDKAVSRRTALKLTGAAASTALVAGCSSDSGGNGNGNNDDSSDSGPVSIKPGKTIMFKANGHKWVGKKPSSIEGQTNPTIELTEGGSYTIGWTQNETGHNLELKKDDESVWNNKSTPTASSTGDGQTLEFTASTKIAEYACNPHYPGMAGDIKVTSGSSSDGGSGNESSGNQSSGNESSGNESSE